MNDGNGAVGPGGARAPFLSWRDARPRPWCRGRLGPRAAAGSSADDVRGRIAMGGGAPGGTRTHGLQVRNLTLYPLSYGRPRRMAEREGFEPSEQVTPLNGLARRGPASADVRRRRDRSTNEPVARVRWPGSAAPTATLLLPRCHRQLPPRQRVAPGSPTARDRPSRSRGDGRDGGRKVPGALLTLTQGPARPSVRRSRARRTSHRRCRSG